MIPPVSKDLETACPKPEVPLVDCQREYGRVTRSAPPQRFRYTVPSSFPSSCTAQRRGFSIGSRSGYWSGFIYAACAPSLAPMARPRVERRSHQDSQPAQHRVHLASDAFALGWPCSQGWKMCACPEHSSSASSKKENAIAVLQESVTKTS